MKAGIFLPMSRTYYGYMRSQHLASGNYAKMFSAWIDHLVISTTRYLTVTGLTPGQKVKFYRTSDGPCSIRRPARAVQLKSFPTSTLKTIRSTSTSKSTRPMDQP